MASLTWDDVEGLGFALYEKYPSVNPLTLRFTDLHKWITELPGFGDSPEATSEGKLEAIQMAWYEEWQDNQ